MVQTFECIAGTHIPILCLRTNSQDYICYKQYSVNVETVYDYKGRFINSDGNKEIKLGQIIDTIHYH